MKPGFKSLLTALALPVSLAVVAQDYAPADSFDADDDIIYEVGAIEIVKTDGAVGEMLKKARPVEPGDVEAPKFAITTKNRKFMMSIGGNITPIVGYDIGNNLYSQDDAGINFVTGDIPVPALTGHKGDFFVNALTSYIDMSLVAFGGTKNQLTGYIKLGTDGISSAIKMKRAYVTWRGFGAGLMSTLMKDGLAVQPPTIDPQGPGGDVSGGAYQLSYTSPSYSGFRFALGLELPTFCSSSGVYRGHDYRSYFGRQVDSSVDQLYPDVPVWVEYQKSESNRVRFSALLRNFAYQDMVSRQRRNIMGWGTMLSGNFSFWEPMVFNFQAVYGKGIANYIQDLAGRPLSFTPKNDELGKMEANPMMGLVFGVSYNATKRLQFNAVGSYTRIWNVGNYAIIDDAEVADANGDKVMTAGTSNFRYSTYVAVNCFYKFTSYLQWGVEYVYGRRNTWNLGGANDSRIQTQICFSF